jgi:hypothetical protein
MGFINSNTLFWNIYRTLVGPLKLLRGIPKYTVIKICLRILYLVSGICRISIHFASIWSFDINLIFCIMWYPWSSIWIGLYRNSKSSKLIFGTSKFFSIPTIKISKYSETFSLRSPFLICQISIW